MTTTLGLTRSATCSVVRLLPDVEAEVMELSLPEELLEPEGATCWMTTLLPFIWEPT